MSDTVLISGLLLLVTAAGILAGLRLGRQQGEAQSRAAAAQMELERAQWQAERSGLAAQVARFEGELAAEGRAHDETRQERDRQRSHSEELEKTMAPMRTALSDLTERIADSERARVRAQTELRDQVSTMSQQFGQATADVRTEARRLSQVLSRNEKRGAWGEMQLRQLVESSGMLKHVHFVEQDHSSTDDGILRPDMVIDLGGGRKAIVDSKVPLDAFLRMAPDADADEALLQHAQGVAQHISKLSDKEYWRRYDSPEFVIMFLPAEGLLSAALEVRPELLQAALDKRVMVATPTTLIAMLHAINHSWRQAEAAEQAREIQELGSEFYRRILKMAKTLAAVGDSITKSASSYDALVSTLETRVLVTGRRMESLSIASDPLPGLEPLDTATRRLNETKWPGVNELEIVDDLGLDGDAAVDSPAPVEDPQTGSGRGADLRSA